MDICKTVYKNRVSTCLSDEQYDDIVHYMLENDIDTISTAIRKIISEYFKENTE